MKCRAKTKSGKRCRNTAGDDGFCHIESHGPEKQITGGSLTPKQERFVNAYISTLNATEAARMAGYKGDENTLSSVGWENLRKPEIEDRIAELTDDYSAGAREVLIRLSKIARGNIMDIFSIDSQNGDLVLDMEKCRKNGTIIQEIQIDEKTYQDGSKSRKYKIKLYAADQALVNLGRHHKLFVDRIEETGKSWLVPVDPEDVDSMDPSEWAAKYGPGNQNGKQDE